MLRSNQAWQPAWWNGRRFYAWHLTFEDRPGIRAAAARYQRSLAAFDGLELVEGRWLHLTLHGLGLTTERTPPDLTQAVTAVGKRLADLPVQRAVVDKWSAAHAAISLTFTDPRPLHTIRDAVRGGLLDSLGLLHEPADNFVPHISLAYVLKDQPAEPVTTALAAVQELPIPLLVREVSLIEMYREAAAYRWEPVAVVQVGLP